MQPYHGGAFWDRIGDDFQDLGRSADTISADVLDAWFPPAPGALELLRTHLDWLCRTSPPVFGDGLVRELGRVRGLGVDQIVLGAGSSALIFGGLRLWVSASDLVVLIDPTYGEYSHVLSSVIGARVERFVAGEGFRFDLERLVATVWELRPRMVVLVNPNSPTGVFVGREELEAALRAMPAETLLWVDETYVDYVGGSLEPLVGDLPNLIVCKSLSKVLALSGLRSAYLATAAERATELRRITPPWAVSSLAQGATIMALKEPDYYRARYGETHLLSEELHDALCGLGLRVWPGCANFLLADLPVGRTAGEFVARCAAQGLYLRDATNMGSRLGDRAVRFAVKDGATQKRMIEILARELSR